MTVSSGAGTARQAAYRYGGGLPRPPVFAGAIRPRCTASRGVTP